jgi:novobiocin biosynthesis protein NovU
MDAARLYSKYLYLTPASPSLSAHYETLLRRLFDTNLIDASTAALEIGSNRGAFLSALAPVVKSVVGMDPAKNVVEVAKRDGIPTICDFFNAASASRLLASSGPLDLIVARHCMAHNQWPHEMLEGVSLLLGDDGVLVIENNYAVKMVAQAEFDQIYHEHMYYFSVSSLTALLDRHGLAPIDAFETSVHGGSIVCIAARKGSRHAARPTLAPMLAFEKGALSSAALERFVRATLSVRHELPRLLNTLISAGHTVAAYGATAKGATLLNYCGLTDREVAYCADSTELKQGLIIPGVGIPIISEREAFEREPDYFLLTAWNYREELIAKARAAGLANAKFIVPVPSPRVLV